MSAALVLVLHALLGVALGVLFYGSLRVLTERLVHGRIGALRLMGWQLLRLGALAAVGVWSARQGAAALGAFAAGLMVGRLAVLAAVRRQGARATERHP